MANRIRTELGGNITVGVGPVDELGVRLFFVELEYQNSAVRLNLSVDELEQLVDLVDEIVESRKEP